MYIANVLQPLIDACQWILEFWHDLIDEGDTLDGSADLPADGHPQPRLGLGTVLAREGVDHQVPARVRAALTIDALELAAAGQPAALSTRAVGHRLGGEPLAALVPPALQKRTAGASSHARAEPVRAGALALLGLIGALQVASQGTRSRSVRPLAAFLAFCGAASRGRGLLDFGRCTLAEPRAAGGPFPRSALPL